MRLIDADAPVRKMDDYVTEHNALRDVERVDGVLMAKSFIDEQPTVDAVQVVRCKDCKFWDRTNMVTDIGFPDLARCLDGHKDYTNEFWFCADGERREEE